jgi:hypothetical protein
MTRTDETARLAEAIPDAVVKAAVAAWDDQASEQDFRGFRSRDLLVRAAIIGAADATRELAGKPSLGVEATSTSTLAAHYRVLDAIDDEVAVAALGTLEAVEARQKATGKRSREDLVRAVIASAVHAARARDMEPEGPQPGMAP